MSRNLLFSEYPMFDRIMEERPDLCRRVLETALGVPVDEVRNVVAERTLQPRASAPTECAPRRLGSHLGRALRRGDADLLPRGPGSTHALLPERHGHCDAAPGSHLRESFIVFICLHDEFKEGLPVYTFFGYAMRAEVVLGHGFKWVVPNASAWEMLPDLRGLLRYVATEEVGGDGLHQPTGRRGAANGAPMERGALVMLTLEEDMAQGRLLQKKKGREEGAC